MRRLDDVLVSMCKGFRHLEDNGDDGTTRVCRIQGHQRMKGA
jgi:hypothetical protein